jgi:hypothetical protein
LVAPEGDSGTLLVVGFLVEATVVAFVEEDEEEEEESEKEELVVLERLERRKIEERSMISGEFSLGFSQSVVLKIGSIASQCCQQTNSVEGEQSQRLDFWQSHLFFFKFFEAIVAYHPLAP